MLNKAGSLEIKVALLNKRLCIFPIRLISACFHMQRLYNKLCNSPECAKCSGH